MENCTDHRFGTHTGSQAQSSHESLDKLAKYLSNHAHHDPPFMTMNWNGSHTFFPLRTLDFEEWNGRMAFISLELFGAYRSVAQNRYLSSFVSPSLCHFMYDVTDKVCVGLVPTVHPSREPPAEGRKGKRQMLSATHVALLRNN